MIARFRSIMATTLVGSLVLVAPASAQTIEITFDDFNVDEGHFATQPTFSGSTNGILTTSTADRDAAVFFEGAGSERLVLNDDATAGGTAQARILSGIGVPANNTAFETTAGDDGWIGLAIKTNSPGWTAQIWLEQTVATVPVSVGNNGSVPKAILADDQWHIYEWNLDDATGGADGWGNVSGIIAGSTTVGNAFHTIDSIIFRQTAMPATATIYFDWVVKSESGSLVPANVTNPDFDDDGDIDGADYLIWQRNLETMNAGRADGNANPLEDAVVDGADLDAWKAKFGTTPPDIQAVPEPASIALAGMALVAGLAAARQRAPLAAR